MINIKRLFIAIITCSIFCSTTTVLSQKINQVDSEGKRTGVWKKNYANGKPRYEGTFLNGKEVGVFKFYENNSSGIPHIVKEYSENSDVALVKFFNYDGKLKTIGKMVGKDRVGEWKYYYTNGKIFSEENYVNGKLSGVLKNYYSNGNLTEESQYRDGLKNGLTKIYTEDAILIEETLYVNGKLNGAAKYYDLKGKIKESGVYEDGKRVGKWEFYIDGEVSKRPKRESHTIPKSN